MKSLARLGGGVGTKESARSVGRGGGWQLKEGTAELPGRNLQHKGNITLYKNVTNGQRGVDTTENTTVHTINQK